MTNRRHRKTPRQIEMLNAAFLRNPAKWTIEESIEIGDTVGLDRDQVAKWNWDMRKAQNIDTSRRTGQYKKSIPTKALIAQEVEREANARARLADEDEVKIALSALPHQRKRFH